MLRHPLTWIAVAGAALMGAVMTSSYIGGLVDPVGHLQDAPIGFVNADAGDASAQLQEQVTASGGGRVDWQVLDSQAAAERKLRDNDLWGAIVVPDGFSAAIAAIGASPTTAQPAELLLLETRAPASSSRRSSPRCRPRPPPRRRRPCGSSWSPCWEPTRCR